MAKETTEDDLTDGEFAEALLAMFKGESPEDIVFLHVFIEVFKADNGKRLREFLKYLDEEKKGDGPLARTSAELAEVLIRHPSFRDLVPH